MTKYNKITYAQAIKEATDQSMKLDSKVIALGQLIDYKPGVFGTTVGLVEKYGKNRVMGFPVSESLMTSVGIGASLAGKRVLLVHIRIDFMMYAMDAIVNWLSLWRFKSDNRWDSLCYCDGFSRCNNTIPSLANWSVHCFFSHQLSCGASCYRIRSSS